MKKAYFQYYETFENIVQRFHDIEEREYMRNLIIRYGLYGEEPDLTPTDPTTEMMSMAFALVKELIDDQVHRREINAENRRLKLQQKQTEAAAAPAEPAKVIKRFTKPTVEEIKAYCEDRNNAVNAQQFFNFYESKGWKIGNAAMKDWKACVRTWEQRNATFGERTQNALPDDRLTL